MAAPAILNLIDQLKGMFYPQTDGKGFLFQCNFFISQQLISIASTVPESQNQLITFNRLMIINDSSTDATISRFESGQTTGKANLDTKR